MRGALTRVDAVLAGLLCAVAAILRNPAVAAVDALVFDEEYYVKDALRYLGRLDGGEVSWVHPPLGKWLTAAGIVLAGDNPLGWRTAAYAAGVVTVALTYLVGRHLLGRVAGALAGLFVVFDGLLVVQSRTAMLDGLLPPLLLGAVLVVLPIFLPQQQPRGPDPREAWEWSRLATAAALLGAGVAVKWSAAPALAVLAVLAAWHLPARNLRAWVSLVAAVCVLPAAVYVASFARFWTSDDSSPLGFLRLHRRMIGYHEGLDEVHAYGSRPASWPLLRRPVSYWYEADGDQVREILALGNPALWWIFLLVLPVVAVAWYRHRQPATALVLLAVLALYVPWFLASRQGFLFYLTPLVPFLALGVAWAVTRLWASSRLWRWLAPVVPAAIVVVGVLYLPLWIGSTISRERWDHLLLFDSWI